LPLDLGATRCHLQGRGRLRTRNRIRQRASQREAGRPNEHISVIYLNVTGRALKNIGRQARLRHIAGIGRLRKLKLPLRSAYCHAPLSCTEARSRERHARRAQTSQDYLSTGSTSINPETAPLVATWRLTCFQLSTNSIVSCVSDFLDPNLR